MHYAVIMAGGAGTRLWPASRASRPKQLLRLFGGKSLMRESFERVVHVIPPERIAVITGTQHVPLVAEELPEILPENLFGEPCGRDTAGAIGLSAAILRERDAEAVVGVFTADHIIGPPERFERAILAGFAAVEQHPEALVTFGIRPVSPHTGYGYIQRGDEIGPGVFAVARFTEKPDADTAARYVLDGRYYWNSGMFVWRTDTVLRQLRQHLPECEDGVTRIARSWSGPQRDEVLSSVYPTLPRISIDYAVMERAPRVLVVEMDCSWVDVGSWAALEAVIAPDAHGNVPAASRVLHLDAKGTITVSEDDHLIATLGVEDLIIVHTRDATLVAHRSQSQRIKELVATIQARFGTTYS
ncbi:MAG: NTP transferase domain-containing protein [Phycisphaerae bacterium]|nr:NTP transferase domain-containing protein [Phycisphaerae bacterium]